MNKKRMIIIGLILVAVIWGAYVFQEEYVNPMLDEEIIYCIAENSELFASTTCPHCIEQEEILGNYTKIFNITYCDIQSEICVERGIQLVPFWIFEKSQAQIGTMTIEELKNATNC